jgi:hypothetical protein
MTRSALHGQCLLGGNHPAGSPYAKQCPLQAAEQRSARAKKAARTRGVAKQSCGPAPSIDSCLTPYPILGPSNRAS